MGRQTVITQLANLIDTALSGFTPSVAVYDYVPSNLQTSPSVTVFGSGTMLEQGTPSILTYAVYVRPSVIYNSTVGADERDAQVALSDLSDAVIDVFRNNRKTAYWSDLNVELKTDVAPVKMMGGAFLSELYTVLVTVYL